MAKALILKLAFCMIFALQLCTAARNCYKKGGRPSQCITPFVNAAFLKDISANNTCGLNGPKHYCVRSMRSKAVCKVCDARKTELAHPATNINDLKKYGNPTWWQSETLLDNKQPVRIVLDLGKAFEVTYVRITFQSPRPYSFAIYKKISTVKDAKWIPFQYYSQDCKKQYGVHSNQMGQMAPKDNQKLAFCSDRNSGFLPFKGAKITFSPLRGRPDMYRFDKSPGLQEWVTVASLRIDLDRLNTFGDEVLGDPNVLRSYYYSISDVVVAGRCKCNGHASECIEAVTNGVEKRFQCKCEHNTDGEDCQRCLPLYNDTPWKRATRSSGNPCSPCKCNGLADSCVFDQKLYRATGRGGRCVDCKNNTEGVNCERCKIRHYRKFANEACKPCNCNPLGSKRLQCNADGQCTCKPGVLGEKCEK
eukprot:Seg80.10 transcript_id=Seg80.10/GoldUCD/mRNA.D3Y31 product="Laminin subunit gamma-1" protein_id=Seg80.10/GoldUCD/D3Y31